MIQRSLSFAASLWFPFGMTDPDNPRSLSAALIRTGARIALIVAFAFLVHLALSWLIEHAANTGKSSDLMLLNGAIILMFVVYILLIAVPFVPGVEIGLSLLMMQGAAIAPAVFAATVLGLVLAFLVGRFSPYRVLCNFLADLGLVAACNMLERLEPLDRRARLSALLDKSPKWLGKLLVRYRYISVAIALNIPGNSIIGGGGGIAVVAGISGLFSTPAIILTFVLAVSPVPLAVWSFGLEALDWFKF